MFGTYSQSYAFEVYDCPIYYCPQPIDPGNSIRPTHQTIVLVQALISVQALVFDLAQTYLPEKV